MTQFSSLPFGQRFWKLSEMWQMWQHHSPAGRKAVSESESGAFICALYLCIVVCGRELFFAAHGLLLSWRWRFYCLFVRLEWRAKCAAIKIYGASTFPCSFFPRHRSLSALFTELCRNWEECRVLLRLHYACWHLFYLGLAVAAHLAYA